MDLSKESLETIIDDLVILQGINNPEMSKTFMDMFMKKYQLKKEYVLGFNKEKLFGIPNLYYYPMSLTTRIIYYNVNFNEKKSMLIDTTSLIRVSNQNCCVIEDSFLFDTFRLNPYSIYYNNIFNILINHFTNDLHNKQ